MTPAQKEKKELFESFARQVIAQHGLSGWNFGWDRAAKRLGFCRYFKKRIQLSLPIFLINPITEAYDTLLHEIAHALCGPEEKHGPRWKEQAAALGCHPRACAEAQGNVLAECAHCGAVWRKHRIPSVPKACGRCCRKFNNGKYTSVYRLTFRKEAD